MKKLITFFILYISIFAQNIFAQNTDSVVCDLDYFFNDFTGETQVYPNGRFNPIIDGGISNFYIWRSEIKGKPIRYFTELGPGQHLVIIFTDGSKLIKYLSTEKFLQQNKEPRILMTIQELKTISQKRIAKYRICISCASEVDPPYEIVNDIEYCHQTVKQYLQCLIK